MLSLDFAHTPFCQVAVIERYMFIVGSEASCSLISLHSKIKDNAWLLMQKYIRRG